MIRMYLYPKLQLGRKLSLISSSISSLVLITLAAVLVQVNEEEDKIIGYIVVVLFCLCSLILFFSWTYITLLMLFLKRLFI